MIRMFVIDKAPLTGALTVALLRARPEIEVVGSALAPNDEVMAKLKTCDVILVNATLSNEEALAHVRKAVQASPRARVLVVGLPDSDEVASKYIRAGAAGYVIEQASAEELLQSVYTCLNCWPHHRQTPGVF
jgi:DNA-binding NarL/FixJ family response regulator